MGDEEQNKPSENDKPAEPYWPATHDGLYPGEHNDTWEDNWNKPSGEKS